jgi:hypothetical protein
MKGNSGGVLRAAGGVGGGASEALLIGESVVAATAANEVHRAEVVDGKIQENRHRGVKEGSGGSTTAAERQKGSESECAEGRGFRCWGLAHHSEGDVRDTVGPYAIVVGI